MSHPLDLATIRIFDQSNRVIGTSFLIDDTKAITCAHVIEEALNIKVQLDSSTPLTVKIDFPLLPEQKTCYARIVSIDQKLDIAGLELTSDPPIGAQPINIIFPEGDLWGREFRSIGFSTPEGAWTPGVLRGKNAEGWIQIEGTKAQGYSVQPGFSGAPVWDEVSQAVIGMIVATEINTSIKTAFCIPSDALASWSVFKDKIKPTNQKAHIFLSYKQNVQPDLDVVNFLIKNLSSQGHTVFSDASIRMGEKWLDNIDKEIKKSDYLIVLLSEASADSEMVQSEIQRAYEYRKLTGHPKVLPIRVAFHDLLPYSISAFLNPLQYISWNDPNDSPRMLEEIIQAINGQLPPKEAIQHIALSQENSISKPLPEFDARVLDTLQMPGGTVRLQDKLYIRRNDDRRLEAEMSRLGSTVTIRAARQSGKSSLLIRGIQQAKLAGADTVLLDMQRVDKDHLTSLDVFVRYFAEYILFKLSLDMNVINHYWNRNLSPQEKLTNLIEDYVVANIRRNLVIGLDEIDRLLQTDFYSEFFGLLRAWHNLRAMDDRWDKLSTIMVISTEPYLLISDFNQSPFNVGENLYLSDFNAEQVQELNIRHGSPINEKEFDELFTLFGGHPYLTRKALYLLVTKTLNWEELKNAAIDEHGPFGDHLRRYSWMIRQDNDLQKALRSIIDRNTCSDEMLHRLLQAGLVKSSGTISKCRCDLYQKYFEGKL